MNKMNKKGFTLIEMLVVIAIIAVLVSIIVPVVGNSTKKAAAAANAANLRSAAASIAVEYLTDSSKFTLETNDTTVNSVNMGKKITAGINVSVPDAKTNGGCPGGEFVAFVNNGAVECYYYDADATDAYTSIEEYADIAGS